MYADDRWQFYFQKNPALTNLSLICSNSQSQTVNQWDEEAIQLSAPVALGLGHAYKFEFIMAEFTGNAHAGFGWTCPTARSNGPSPPTDSSSSAARPSHGGSIAKRWFRTNNLDDPDGDQS